MKTGVTFVAGVLLILELTSRVSAKREKRLDVSSILDFFSDSDADEVTETTSEKPATTRRKSRIESSESGGKKCKCEKRVNRKLRREIKNVSFQQCQYQGLYGETIRNVPPFTAMYKKHRQQCIYLP